MGQVGLYTRWRSIRCIAAVMTLASAVLAFHSAQASGAGIITTVAGGGVGDGGSATNAVLYGPTGVAVDDSGNLFIADACRVREVTSGTITTFAGTGACLYLGDNGPAASAAITPVGLTVDASGNVYIAGGCHVREVNGGTITTVAGGGYCPYAGDGGTATIAGVDPNGVAVDAAGTILIADTGNCRIRAVNGGTIWTVAGISACGYGGDSGPATNATLNYPRGLAVDSSYNVYIADSFNCRIRKVSGGMITTVAGNGSCWYGGDGGSATSAMINQPSGVAIDALGNLFIADFANCRIREVSAGTITTVAGNGSCGYGGDGGTATSAMISNPSGIAVDAAGNLYIADSSNCRIRKVSGGTITTVAGNGWCGYGGDGGPANGAALNGPQGVAVGIGGTVYIADGYNCRVRKVNGGTITTIAGDGTCGFSGDGGAATSAEITFPYGVADDIGGNLYIVDGSCRIRMVSGGTITTIAGNGSCSYGGDGGPASNASLNYPMGVAVDPGGNLYIADYDNCRIRKVSGGTITTVAGNGSCGYGGDGGSPTSASLNHPMGVALDAAGNLYIADFSNCRVRMVSGTTITSVAGNGTCAFGGDGGPATSASIYSAAGVAVDSAGNLYIADRNNNRVREVSGGIITTVAGDGGFGSGNDGGSAIGTSVYGPTGVAVDASGNVYFIDANRARVREVRFVSVSVGGVAEQPDIAIEDSKSSQPDNFDAHYQVTVALAALGALGAFAWMIWRKRKKA